MDELRNSRQRGKTAFFHSYSAWVKTIDFHLRAVGETPLIPDEQEKVKPASFEFDPHLGSVPLAELRPFAPDSYQPSDESIFAVIHVHQLGDPWSKIPGKEDW